MNSESWDKVERRRRKRKTDSRSRVARRSLTLLRQFFSKNSESRSRIEMVEGRTRAASIARVLSRTQSPRGFVHPRKTRDELESRESPARHGNNLCLKYRYRTRHLLTRIRIYAHNSDNACALHGVCPLYSTLIFRAYPSSLSSMHREERNKERRERKGWRCTPARTIHPLLTRVALRRYGKIWQIRQISSQTRGTQLRDLLDRRCDRRQRGRRV